MELTHGTRTHVRLLGKNVQINLLGKRVIIVRKQFVGFYEQNDGKIFKYCRFSLFGPVHFTNLTYQTLND